MSAGAEGRRHGDQKTEDMQGWERAKQGLDRSRGNCRVWACACLGASHGPNSVAVCELGDGEGSGSLVAAGSDEEMGGDHDRMVQAEEGGRFGQETGDRPGEETRTCQNII